MTRLADTIQEYVTAKKPIDENWAGCAIRYYQYLQSHKPSTEYDEIAYNIFDDETQREILEALLLANCPYDDIVEAFDIPKETIQIYSTLFFDVNNFKTKLAKISYIENYPEVFGRELKIRAVNLGYEYVLYTYGNIVPKTARQKELIQRMFMSSAYKAMNINYAAMNSAAMKQAVEHGKLMLKAYELIDHLNNNDNQDETYSLLSIIPALPKQTEHTELQEEIV